MTPLLQAKGVKVIAVQNPLSSLADDVAAVQRVQREQIAGAESRNVREADSHKPPPNWRFVIFNRWRYRMGRAPAAQEQDRGALSRVLSSPDVFPELRHFVGKSSIDIVRHSPD